MAASGDDAWQALGDDAVLLIHQHLDDHWFHYATQVSRQLRALTVEAAEHRTVFDLENVEVLDYFS